MYAAVRGYSTGSQHNWGEGGCAVFRMKTKTELFEAHMGIDLTSANAE